MTDHPSLDPNIAAYYARGGERDRLRADRLEEVRTRELLARFLPPPPATVLDVGGGAGAYAVGLAAEGYDVHLVDPVALHVEQARAAAAGAGATLASASVGDARHLDFADGAADAVLLFGPLYHLTERTDRIAALREARRVLRPNGLALAVAISRFTSTYDGLIQGLLAQDGFEEMMARDVLEGQHRNPDLDTGWFTTAYFHLPDGLAAELAEGGLTVEALLIIEGPSGAMPDADAWLADDVMRGRLLRAIRRIEAEPSILGAGGHIMAVGRKS